MPKRQVWPWLAISLAVALASAFGPFTIQSVIDIRESIWLSGIWLFLLIAALIVKRKQGLWLLVGLPFAAYMPAAAVLIAWGCSQDIKNCP